MMSHFGMNAQDYAEERDVLLRSIGTIAPRDEQRREWINSVEITVGGEPFVHKDRAPIEVERDTVRLRVEHLTPSTFNRWTDGSKWICDTVNAGIKRQDGVGKIAGTVADIKEFITTYPHPVGTFYLIVSRIRSAVEIVEANPERDIRVLLIPD
jgi:hypothetical protein